MKLSLLQFNLLNCLNYIFQIFPRYNRSHFNPMLNFKIMAIIASLVFLLSITSSRSTFKVTPLDGQELNYGSLVKLYHPQTQFMLHSHGVRFGMGGTYSVTGYVNDDHGSYWQINEKHQSKTKTFTDMIKCGDYITLRSAIMDYYLQTEQTSTGLTSQLNQFIRGITNEGVINNRVNWKVLCETKNEGQKIVFGDFVRLRHENTGKYASLSRSFVYSDANCGMGCILSGQLQPHAIDEANDDRTIFQVVAGMNYREVETNEEVQVQ